MKFLATQYARAGSEFLVNTTFPGNQHKPTLTALAGGGFASVWSEFASGVPIRGQLFNSAGTKTGGEFPLAVPGGRLADNVTTTALANGGFVVAWDQYGHPEDPSQYDARAQLFSSSGAKVGTDFSLAALNGNYQGQPNLSAIPGGGFIATWSDAQGDGQGSGIRAQIFSDTGARVGGDFLVNSSAAFNQQNPVAAVRQGEAAGNGILIAWQDMGSDQITGTGIRAQRFDLAGNKLGAEISVVSGAAGNFHQPSIAYLTGGGFVVLWENRAWDNRGTGNVEGQLFGIAGNPIGAMFTANTGTVGEQSQPSVAPLPNGGFAVVWSDFSLRDDDTSGAIRAQFFTVDYSGAGAQKDGGEILVNTVTARDQQEPAIAILRMGELVVSWTDNGGSGDGAGSSIKAQVFAPATGAGTDIALSNSVVNEAAVENLAVATISSNGPVTSGRTYSIVSDSSGGAFRIDGDKLVVADSARLDHETRPEVALVIKVTNTSDGSSYQETMTIGVTDAAAEARYAAGGEFLVNSNVAGDQMLPVVAGYSGGYVVVFLDDYVMKGQLFNTAGEKLGGEFLVAGANAMYSARPVVTSLASGGFAVAYEVTEPYSQAGPRASIQVQLFDAAGAKAGTAITAVAAGNMTDPAIAALPDGRFVISWTDNAPWPAESGTGVRARIYDSAGNPLGDVISVNRPAEYDQRESSVSPLANGGFVITWSDPTGHAQGDGSNGVQAQMFSATGEKIGGEIAVNTTTADHQHLSSVAGLAQGGFVVAFADGFQDYSGVRLQIFDASGAKLGGEILVDALAGTSFPMPTVAALPWGGFALSWTDVVSTASDTSGAAVRTQIFDGRGMPVGDEFQLNFNTLFDQAQPSIALLANGSMVFSWNDFSGDSGFSGSVKARVLTLTEAPALARPDSFQVAEDGIVGAGLSLFADNGSGPDSDADGPALAIGSINGAAANLGKQIVLASGALLTVNADGTFAYDPNDAFNTLAPGAHATDGFDYGLKDGTTGRATITINGVWSPGDIYYGTPGNDTAAGTGFDETFIVSQGGEDSVNGGGGNDVILFGGALSLGDSIDGGSGDDRLVLQGQYAFDLGIVPIAGIERIALLGAPAGTATPFSYTLTLQNAGVAAGQMLTIDAGALGPNEHLSLNGRDERDARLAVKGGAGGDLLTGGAMADLIDGGAGDDSIDGGAGDDTLIGGGGADRLDGGTGADIMSGGSGGDIYIVDNGGDAAIEAAGEGLDAVYASIGYALRAGSEIETLATSNYLSTAALDLTGNEFNNNIVGNNGNNSLVGGAGDDYLSGLGGGDVMNGGLGADFMAGGTGDDVYVVDSPSDVVLENAGEGFDAIYTSASNSLRAGVEIELFGTTDATATTDLELGGNEFNNNIVGNAGNNALHGDAGDDYLSGLAGIDIFFGGAGADFMVGGLGGDIYHVDSAYDVVLEKAGEGYDAIYTSSSIGLRDGVEVERIGTQNYLATTAIYITGNEFGQEIIANNGNNTLSGMGGND
ncbi:MAG TPA: Ig-like domain-containing protein, partial [Allosphingosinicella sp.]